jgi:hypothetical protein
MAMEELFCQQIQVTITPLGEETLKDFLNHFSLLSLEKGVYFSKSGGVSQEIGFIG